MWVRKMGKSYTSKRQHGQLPNVNPKIHSQRSYVQHPNFELMCRWISIPPHIQMQIKHFMKCLRESQQHLIKMKNTYTHTYTQFMIEKRRKELFCTRSWLIAVAITNRIKNTVDLQLSFEAFNQYNSKLEHCQLCTLCLFELNNKFVLLNSIRFA